MITPKAQQLADEARRVPRTVEYQPEAQIKSSAAFDCLFETSTPTLEEFDNFAYGLILSAKDLYRLVLYVPKWQKEENE